MNSLISVIVPIYNTEKYLNKCIDSIVNQTYKNLEIFLINDGSMDHSLEICKEFSKKDERIKIVDKENTGVSNTRNVGLTKATGDFIMFIDSDDFIDLDYIEKMYMELEKNKYDVVISGMTFCDIKEKVIKRELYRSSSQELKYNEIERDIVNTLYFCSVWKMLFRKGIIEENKIKFKEHLKYGEDLMFSNQILKFSKKIGYLSNTGYYYRQDFYCNYHRNTKEQAIKYFQDNLEIFEQFGRNDLLIANRIFTKMNITLRKIVSIEDIKYEDFKNYSQEVITMYNASKINKKVDINLIDYESKINLKLLKYLKNNRFYRYYLTVKMINFIKHIFRK